MIDVLVPSSEAIQPRDCFICGAPGVCRHRERELLPALEGFEPPRPVVERKRTPAPTRAMLRQLLTPRPKDSLHWASILIAREHAKDADTPCVCPSCVAVRAELVKRGIVS